MMAAGTPVNSQITDAVTQANSMVLAIAPAQALGAIYQVMAQATGLSMQNAVAHQQQMNAITSAVTTQGVNLLYGVPTASAARSFTSDLDLAALTTLLGDLRALLRSLSAQTPTS
jgi:hypothetical protein